MLHVEHLCQLARVFGGIAKNSRLHSYTAPQIHGFTNSRICGFVNLGKRHAARPNCGGSNGLVTQVPKSCTVSVNGSRGRGYPFGESCRRDCGAIRWSVRTADIGRDLPLSHDAPMRGNCTQGLGKTGLKLWYCNRFVDRGNAFADDPIVPANRMGEARGVYRYRLALNSS
jgi:hypothetical protein